MKIWKAIRTAAARFFGIRQREQEQESEKQQQDDAQNGAQSGESVQAGISSQEAEKAVTEDTGRQEEGEKELPAEIQTLPEATMKQIHELIEYEERISQIADMTGADPDLIKSRIEEYAKMKEKTPLEAANCASSAGRIRRSGEGSERNDAGSGAAPGRSIRPAGRHREGHGGRPGQDHAAGA